MNPSVSVVIPCYNAEGWICRSIQSVLNHRNLTPEVIVIDDGSTDKSLEMIRSFGYAVRWETGPNQGGCIARNRGLNLSESEYIIFLDADDYIEPDSIAEWAACGSDADIVFGPFAYESDGRRAQGKALGSGVTTNPILNQWLGGWFTPPCSVLWRQSFLCAIGGWNPAMLRNQDGELVIRALLNGARAVVAHHGLGIYVQHGSAGRVSKRTGRRILTSEFSAFEDLWTLALRRGQSQLRDSFAKAFYRIAYEAFANRFDDLGYVALERARQLGLKGHTGTLAHRTLSGILGLRNKLRITGLVRGRTAVARTGGAP